MSPVIDPLPGVPLHIVVMGVSGSGKSTVARALQERLGQEVAATLEAMIAPRGAAVAIEATHLCTRMRGVSSMNRPVSPGAVCVCSCGPLTRGSR